MIKDKILICDDEEGVRESLSLILREKYELVFAEDGEETIGIIKSMPDIKIVLLDIKMPRKSGLEVLKDIKSHNNGIAVIIVTGYQSAETAAETIKEGAADYIVKPLHPQTVLDTIERSLS